jgi:hypothetical protein
MPNNARLNGSVQEIRRGEVRAGPLSDRMFMDAQQPHREGDINEPNTPENREPITEVSDHAPRVHP